MKQHRGYLLLTAAALIVLFGILSATLVSIFTRQSEAMNHLQASIKAKQAANSGAEYLPSRLFESVLANRSTCDALSDTLSIFDARANLYITANTPFNASPLRITSSLVKLASSYIELSDTTGFAPSGRIRIGTEIINYGVNDTTNQRLTQFTRAAHGSALSKHPTGAIVSQYLCGLESQGRSPITNTLAVRNLVRPVELPLIVASGESGSILSFGAPGGLLNWQAITLGNSLTLNGLKLLNADDGWGVGNRIGGNQFSIDRLSASGWQHYTITSNNAQNLNAVDATSGFEAWAVGLRNGNKFTILRWLGGSATNWCQLTTNKSCGKKKIQISSSQNAEKDLMALAMADTKGKGYATLGFAVGGQSGESGQGTTRALITRYNGSTWKRYHLPASQGNLGKLFDIVLIKRSQKTPLDGFAVGRSSLNDAEGKIIRYDAGTWDIATITTTQNQLYAIDALDTNQDGLIDYAWAVGRAGIAYEYKNGAWQSPTVIENNIDFHSITLIGIDDGWAVGQNGRRYHWNGSTWVRYESGVNTQVSLNALDSVATDVHNAGTTAYEIIN